MWMKSRMSAAFKEKMTKMAQKLMAEGPPRSRSAERRKENAELAAALAESAALEEERKRRAALERRHRADEEDRLIQNMGAALAASAALERERRAASAQRRQRQAEGGHELEAALAESAALEEERKRAASDEERRRKEFGVWTEEDIAALLPLEAAMYRPGNIRTSRRNRRRSVAKAKNPLARHTIAPMQASCVSDGVSATRLYTFSRELLSCIHADGGPQYSCFEYPHPLTQTFQFPETIETSGPRGAAIPMTCTAMIILFGFGNHYGHFVPYVRIRNQWFMADNEKGGLVRRTNGMPNGRTKYYNPDGTLSGTIDRVVTFFAEDSSIRTADRIKIDTGLPVFGQTKDTCGPDGLQSILMFADGFHEYFYAALYRRLVPSFNPLFWGGTHQSVTDAQVNTELQRLKASLKFLMLGEAGVGEGGSHGEAECDDPTKDFLLSMFLRLYRIENIPEEELQGINWGLNTTAGEGEG